MKRQPRIVIATLALFATGAATAQTVYKSVDANGRVTYSSSPPPDAAQEMVEKVPVAPGPTKEQQQAAAQRSKELQAATKRAEKQRQESSDETKKSKSEAEKARRQAEIALQEAKIKSDDDWQYLATGGRVLKQTYLDRVKEAESRVKQADKALRESRSTKR